MRIIECKQGDDAWITARLGIPTASNFHRIVTPSGQLSKQSDKYLGKLVAEWFLGFSLDEVQSQFMERGSELEKEAFLAYEFETGLTTTEVGFCVRDDGRVGGSPDRLVGDDGGLEIKCPKPEIHMGYVLGGLEDEYRTQTQGNLWVAERDWWDLMSYHPTLPKARKRLRRDDPFIATLANGVGEFVERLEEAKARLAGQKSERDEALQEIAAHGDHPF